MSEQNLYAISYEYYKGKSKADDCTKLQPDGWDEAGPLPGDTWQDAAHDWLTHHCVMNEPYQVVSETPSEDSRSGIMEITDDNPGRQYVKATIIEDD